MSDSKIKLFCCKLCGKVAKTKQALERHAAYHNNDRPYSCEVCSQCFKNTDDRGKHIRRLKKDGKYENACKVCHKHFKSQDLLSKHLEMLGCEKNKKRNAGLKDKPQIERDVEVKNVDQDKHDDEKEEIKCFCKDCEEEFGSTTALKLHYKECHTDSKKQVCLKCGQTLSSKDSLMRHYNIFHQSEYPFQCSYCSQKFKVKESLYRHVKFVHKDGGYKCDICYRIFSQPVNLKKHMAVHSMNKEFSCEVCGKEFRWKQSLQKHALLHVGTSCVPGKKSPKKMKLKDKGNKRSTSDETKVNDTGAELNQEIEIDTDISQDVEEINDVSKNFQDIADDEAGVDGKIQVCEADEQSSESSSVEHLYMLDTSDAESIDVDKIDETDAPKQDIRPGEMDNPLKRKSDSCQERTVTTEINSAIKSNSIRGLLNETICETDKCQEKLYDKHQLLEHSPSSKGHSFGINQLNVTAADGKKSADLDEKGTEKYPLNFSSRNKEHVGNKIDINSYVTDLKQANNIEIMLNEGDQSNFPIVSCKDSVTYKEVLPSNGICDALQEGCDTFTGVSVKKNRSEIGTSSDIDVCTNHRTRCGEDLSTRDSIGSYSSPILEKDTREKGERGTRGHVEKGIRGSLQMGTRESIEGATRWHKTDVGTHSLITEETCSTNSDDSVLLKFRPSSIKEILGPIETQISVTSAMSDEVDTSTTGLAGPAETQISVASVTSEEADTSRQSRSGSCKSSDIGDDSVDEDISRPSRRKYGRLSGSSPNPPPSPSVNKFSLIKHMLSLQGEENFDKSLFDNPLYYRPAQLKGLERMAEMHKMSSSTNEFDLSVKQNIPFQWLGLSIQKNKIQTGNVQMLGNKRDENIRDIDTYHSENGQSTELISHVQDHPVSSCVATEKAVKLCTSASQYVQPMKSSAIYVPRNSVFGSARGVDICATVDQVASLKTAGNLQGTRKPEYSDFPHGLESGRCSNSSALNLVRLHSEPGKPTGSFKNPFSKASETTISTDMSTVSAFSHAASRNMDLQKSGCLNVTSKVNLSVETEVSVGYRSRTITPSPQKFSGYQAMKRLVQHSKETQGKDGKMDQSFFVLKNPFETSVSSSSSLIPSSSAYNFSHTKPMSTARWDEGQTGRDKFYTANKVLKKNNLLSSVPSSVVSPISQSSSSSSVGFCVAGHTSTKTAKGFSSLPISYDDTCRFNTLVSVASSLHNSKMDRSTYTGSVLGGLNVSQTCDNEKHRWNINRTSAGVPGCDGRQEKNTLMEVSDRSVLDMLQASGNTCSGFEQKIDHLLGAVFN